MRTKEELQSLPVEDRWNIARYGIDDEERILLVDDESEFVRGMLAKYGPDEIRKLLVTDPHPRVIEYIKIFGGKEIIEILNKVQSL